MKRILIAVSQLRVGGVSKALINLLKSIEDRCDVTLVCFDHEGELFKHIPPKIKVIDENPYLVLTERSAGELERYGNKYRIMRIVCSTWTKLINKKLPAMYICHKCEHIMEHYDVALAFGHPQQEKMFCNLAGEFILNCVTASKKIIVIHCDYEKYGGHCKYNDKLLLRFDKIAVVSKSVGEAVVRCIPEADSRICTLRNFHDYESIINMSNENPIHYVHKHTLVTVARLSYEKGLLLGVDIIKTLKNEGYDLEWHIIGNGPMKTELEKRIMLNKAEKYIFLEGEQNNPYRFLKEADYLFVPSIHEAAPMVFDEAASLGVPIISTDTLSADEMVKKRNIGYVCKKTQLIDTIKTAFNNQLKWKMQMKNYIFSNTDAMEDFQKICSD